MWHSIVARFCLLVAGTGRETKPKCPGGRLFSHSTVLMGAMEKIPGDKVAGSASQLAS